MDDAINTRTRQRVRADDVASRRGWRTLDFECPGCRNPVHLRNGRRRLPHFAHLPGYDTEDCSYYHGGTGGGSGGFSDAVPTPLPLYLEARTGKGGDASWTLYVAIPRTESPHGRITVVDGLTGRSRLNCSMLVDGGRRVPVRPQESDYRIEVTPDVSPPDAERVAIGTPGLDGDAPTLFRAGISGGRRLADDDDLTWGEPYFAIWDAAKAPVFPPHVTHQELAALDSRFRVGVFQLPSGVDENVRRWIADSLYRRVAAPGVTLSVISPVTLPGLEEELRVDARQEVVIALISPGGTHHLRDLTLVDNATGILRRIRLKTGPDVLHVSIGVLGLRRITVSTEDEYGDSEAELSLEGYQPSLRVTAPAVQLIADDVVLPAERRAIPLHSRAAASLLVRVRNGEATLEDVLLPPSVSCELRVSGHVQPTLPVSDPAYRRTLLERSRQFLAEGLAFEIDAGSFGRATVAARDVARASATRANTLTTACRERMRAMKTMAASPAMKGTALSLEPQLITQLKAATAGLHALDADLLRSFAALRWHTGALPQARALASQILSNRKQI